MMRRLTVINHDQLSEMEERPSRNSVEARRDAIFYDLIHSPPLDCPPGTGWEQGRGA